MRSLFLKIFLWFWLAMVLVGLALVITWSMQPDIVVSHWRASTGEAVALYAQSAAEELDRYGAVALGNYLERLHSSANIRTALLDSDGHLIAGSVSQRAQAFARQTTPGGGPAFSISVGDALAAQRASGPSGHDYIFIAEMPRGPFGALHLPASTQVLRLALAVLISGIICYLLARYLTGPILRLRAATTQLAAGDLTARATSHMEQRRDELGDLVRDFNRMADRIEDLLTNQQQLIRDISHELRSPLARLNVALGLARQRAGAEAAAPLDRIEREAERLNELIGRLLTLARIQAAVGPPEKSNIDLLELVSEVVSDADFEAQERGCRVRLNGAAPRAAGASEPLPSGACTVSGSPELLRSAVENVIRNAVRYTGSGTEVEITLSLAGRYFCLEVRDHGPGVPDTELPNLFRPFYRVTTARDRQSGGTGLGLAIAERVVRLHGGTITAENMPGGGLRLRICLPHDGTARHEG